LNAAHATQTRTGHADRWFRSYERHIAAGCHGPGGVMIASDAGQRGAGAWPRNIAIALGATGLGLHTYTALIKGNYGARGAIAFIAALWAWSLLPYAVGLFLSLKLSYHLQAVGWLIGVLMMDVGMYRAVFVHPHSSTAALGLLFMPGWNLVVFGPLGGLLGWMVSRARKART
jgi:hypothetical protein